MKKTCFAVCLSLAFFMSNVFAVKVTRNILSLFSMSDNGVVGPSIVLNKATGNEAAYTFNYTTNKATSGDDTGLLINFTDTASPGDSNILECKTGGVQMLFLRSDGKLYVRGAVHFLDSSPTIAGEAANATLTIRGGTITTTDGQIDLAGATVTATEGSTYGVKILPVYNQTSGTASNTDLVINRTQTAIGSGTQYLIDAQVGGATKFSVSNTGVVTLATGVNTDTSTPVAVGQLVVNSSYVLYISTGTGLAQYQKVGAQ